MFYVQMQGWGRKRLAERSPLPHSMSIYYLLTLLVKRDRERRGGKKGREKREWEREIGRVRWMYQTAAPCWVGNGKAAGTNMNISADSYSSLYPPPPSVCHSLTLSVSHLFLLSASLPLNPPPPPTSCFSAFTLLWSGQYKGTIEMERPARTEFWVAETKNGSWM